MYELITVQLLCHNNVISIFLNPILILITCKYLVLMKLQENALGQLYLYQPQKNWLCPTFFSWRNDTGMMNRFADNSPSAIILLCIFFHRSICIIIYSSKNVTKRGVKNASLKKLYSRSQPQGHLSAICAADYLEFMQHVFTCIATLESIQPAKTGVRPMTFVSSA